MYKKHIFNYSLHLIIAILAILSGLLLFIRILGFTLVFSPRADVVASSIISIIILVLTVFGIVKKCERPKMPGIIYGLLPGLAIAFILLISNAMDGYSYFVLAFITLVCSMTLFFTGTSYLLTKILLGIVYSLVIIPMIFILFLMTVLPPFGHNEVEQSALSPSGYHKAEIWSNSQGALGGATWIYLTCQSDHVNLIFAQLERRPVRVYSGRWGEFERMNLNWRTDDLLFVEFDTTLTFRFNGLRWVREEIE